jgi:hypothetical protein
MRPTVGLADGLMYADVLEHMTGVRGCQYDSGVFEDQKLERETIKLQRLYPAGELSEDDYAFLHDTHGLPRELVSELAVELRVGY